MCNKKILCSLMFFFVAIFMSSSALSEAGRSSFDHFDTSFPLTGLHIDVTCGACHINGVFKGTPQECKKCHNGVLASGKPANHVPSDDNCDDCHTTFSMSDARFEHDVITAACSSCHNGVTAMGKNVGHITNTQECDTCHVTASWLNVRFDHSLVTGPCSSCHNGSTAEGKPVTHIVTAQECDSCHTTATWLNARVDHSLLTAPCSSCHNGSTASGKSAGHIVTSQECDACHDTNTWLNANVDHTLITGSCSSCHNNITATGKPAGHALTSDDCALCHTTVNWSLITFAHSSIGNHNSSVTCIDCHIGNNFALPPWKSPGYAPDCAACHVSDYKSGPHKKTEVPTTVFYTVDELRDCTGSCHLYEDNSFTVINKTRTGEHRINASQF